MECKKWKLKNIVEMLQQITVPTSWWNLQKHWNENKCKTGKSGYETSISHGQTFKEYVKVQQKTF
jgi:hypothetical protein